MHVLGIIFLAAAAALFGVLRSHDLKKQPRELAALIGALTLFKHDLVSRTLPLPDAIVHVSGHCRGDCRVFFLCISDKLRNSTQTLHALWSEESAKLPAIGSQAQTALAELGAHLGNYDAQAQAEAIDSCIDTLKNSAEYADERAKRLGKLYTGLGLTIGAMLAVVLY